MSLSIDTIIMKGMSNDFYAPITARRSVQFPQNGRGKVMVGARGVEPLTSTVSGHIRGNIAFPLYFFLATLVNGLQDRMRASFPDISGSYRLSTRRKLYSQRPLPKFR
jgi:hypothetical protein